MRKLLRAFLPVAVLFSLSLLSVACSGLQAPVEPFSSEPTTVGGLLSEIEPRHPQVKHLGVRMKVQVSGGSLIGWQNIILTLRYEMPDRVFLRADLPNGQEIFWLIQNVDSAAVYLPGAGEFYTGTLAELDEHPNELYGVRPTDVVRTILVGQEIVSMLTAADPAIPLPPAPGDTDYWVLGTDPAWNRKELYFLRRKDGLVEKVGIYGQDREAKAVVNYKRYKMFNGIMFPSEFDLSFQASKLHLAVKEVEFVDVGNVSSPDIYKLLPPANSGIRVQSFRDWFARPDLIDPQNDKVD